VDLVTVQAIENPKDSQEQVQDIQVQGNRCSDLILDMELPHDELGVNQNVRREQNRHRRTIKQLDHTVPWEKHADKAKDDNSSQ